jgi:hypothetical protein
VGLIKYLKDNNIYKYINSISIKTIDTKTAKIYSYGDVKLSYKLGTREFNTILSINDKIIINIIRPECCDISCCKIIPNDNACLNKIFADFNNIYIDINLYDYKWFNLFEYILEHPECFDLVT